MTVNTHLRSDISTTNARSVTLNIKEYYDEIPTSEYEYYQITISSMSTEIIYQRNLQANFSNNEVYLKYLKNPSLSRVTIYVNIGNRPVMS